MGKSYLEESLTEYAEFQMPSHLYTIVHFSYLSSVRHLFPKQRFPAPRSCTLGSFVHLPARGLLQMTRNHLSRSYFVLSVLPWSLTEEVRTFWGHLLIDW